MCKTSTANLTLHNPPLYSHIVCQLAALFCVPVGMLSHLPYCIMLQITSDLLCIPVMLHSAKLHIFFSAFDNCLGVGKMGCRLQNFFAVGQHSYVYSNTIAPVYPWNIPAKDGFLNLGSQVIHWTSFLWPFLTCRMWIVNNPLCI